MKKPISHFVFLTIIFTKLFFGSQSISAQCNTIIEPAESCEFQFLLDGNALEDGFCSTLPNSNAIPNLTPFCFGISSSENTGFFLIEPITEELVLKITPMNCTEITIPGQGVFSGMQAAIFKDCSFSEFAACAPTCHPDAFTIGASDLEPNKLYVLALDGCNGSICDFSIEVVSGEISALLPLGDPELSSPMEVCQFDQTEIRVEGLPLLTEGAWTVDGGVGFDVRFNGKAITVNDWGAPGLKSICATITNPDNTAMFYDSCWTVLVKTAPSLISISEGDSICPGEPVNLAFQALAFDSYNWTWNGGGCSNCPIPNVTMGNEILDVQLTVSNNSNCSLEQTITFIPSTAPECLVAIPELEAQRFIVAPNPFTGFFAIESEGIIEATVYNSQGKIQAVLSGKDKLTISSEDWATGIYFLSTTSESGSNTLRKLIKF